MREIVTLARRDPAGAGIAILGPLLIVLLVLTLAERYAVPQLLSRMPASRLLEAPPPQWLASARRADVLTVPGIAIAYWGRPDAPYGAAVTSAARPYRAIVVHYTTDAPIVRLVQYQHNGDSGRGGHFGYHIYIDRAGRVLQGAPLTVRTNHVKPRGARERRDGPGRMIDSTNSIGVSLVGACVPAGRGLTGQCSREHVTAEQMGTGMAVIAALQSRYAIPCRSIYGHGELQTDRASFEGSTLTTRWRAACDLPALPIVAAH